jgi:glc operon protein GlcG
VTALYRAGDADDVSAYRLPQAQRSRSTVKTGFLHRFFANKEEPTMRRQTSAALLVLLGSAGFALGAGTASAQDNLAKFVVTGDAAKKAMTREEISADTAEKITKACLDFAAQNKIAVSVFILAPSGQVVVAHRMDGQNPVNVETALWKAQTALKTHGSTHAAANRYADDITGELTRIKFDAYWVSGGLPIVVDNVLIGSIGVGGSGLDEECANAGLTAVLGPQPPLAEKLPPRNGRGATPAAPAQPAQR